MGIGLPLHWLEAAAVTVVNAVGSLLFVGLDFKRPLWLAWVRALASDLIIFLSSSESSARSLRLYSRINDYPKSDLSASRICFCLSINNFSPFSSEAWTLSNWRAKQASLASSIASLTSRLNRYWSSLPLFLNRWGSSNLSFLISLSWESAVTACERFNSFKESPSNDFVDAKIFSFYFETVDSKILTTSASSMIENKSQGRHK